MGATGGAGWSGVSEGGAWQPQTHCQEAATLQELSPHPPISPAGAAALRPRTSCPGPSAYSPSSWGGQWK